MSRIQAAVASGGVEPSDGLGLDVVDPELGLSVRALEGILGWARRRADELLADLHDDELRQLLGESAPLVGLDAGAREPAVAPVSERRAEMLRSLLEPPAEIDRRSTPRHDLDEPAVIEIGSWGELVDGYARDIGCGGMFVATASPPGLGARAAVELRLPGQGGVLRFAGLVVHVTSMGFGLQFSGLTPEARQGLQRFLAQARRAAADPREPGPTLALLESPSSDEAATDEAATELVDGPSSEPDDDGSVGAEVIELHRHRTPSEPTPPERSEPTAPERSEPTPPEPIATAPSGPSLRVAKAELAVLMRRDDHGVLGVGPSADEDALRVAFEQLARRWHPAVAHAQASPEMQAVATAIFLRVEQAYQRLSAARRGPGRAPVDGSAGTSSTVAAPYRAAMRRRSLRPQRVEPSPDRHATSSERTSPPSVVTPEAAAVETPSIADEPASGRPSPSDPVKEALAHMAARRWAQAIEPLEAAIRRSPGARLEVLLLLARARQSAVERDFSGARRHYEALLERSPGHPIAQRELLMISAVTG